MRVPRYACRVLGGILWIAGVAGVCGQSPTAYIGQDRGVILDQGVETYHTPDFTLGVARSSGTVTALKPTGVSDFDFTPAELLPQRSADGYYHLGDLDLRLRSAGEANWKGYSTALARGPVTSLSTLPGQLRRDDLAPTLPTDIPIRVTRAWALTGGKLALQFSLRNTSPRAVEIGSLAIPLIFDNVMTGKTLEQAHAMCSFSDPSIALDAGYVQVTRLSGHGPALLVVPDGKTPLEAYNPIPGPRGKDSKPALFHDLTERSITFEGFYEWMAISGAYQQNEWKQAAWSWNRATTISLRPGQERTFGVRFILSDSIRSIEKTLAENERPVAVGIPGYILPTDTEGSLFLQYARPVEKMDVEPAGALQIQAAGVTEHGWRRYALRGKQWGDAHLTITYGDGLIETIPYRVIKPEVQAVADLGNFLFSKQWFDVSGDPFHRSPSVISYDREANAPVTQDHRVWIAGLSDEAGAGSWLAAAMKEYAQPDREQVEKLEQFVDGVLWGHLQDKDGAQKFGVRKSLFYYQPDKMPAGYYRADTDWSTWESWDQKASDQVNRSYDYPHVVAAYWVLYRLARDHEGLVTHHDWRWYLTQACETTLAMTRYASELAQFGQMEGSVFVTVLEDLRREGMTDEAARVEAAMRARAQVWWKLAYPFGSEMPWDSTGQEEVYAWSRFFGMNDQAQATLDAITGYMPAIPSWGYNGSARRYWDFLFGGKYERLERQLHHYGSGLNAVPVLDAYRRDPEDLYLLRIGYGGNMGALTGIDQDGFASAAFHSYPDRMTFDPYSGDYGPNFFGHVWEAGAYLVKDAEFGWLAFGGNAKVAGDLVILEPRDSLRQRVYIAPLGLWLTLDSGRFAGLAYNPASRSVVIDFDPKDAFTADARLRIDQPAKPARIGTMVPEHALAKSRGAYEIPLGAGTVSIRLVASE